MVDDIEVAEANAQCVRALRALQLLEMAHTHPLERVDEQLENLLHHPVGTPSLADLARGRKNACVVISDITRPVPNQVILPPRIKRTVTASHGALVRR